MFPFSWKLPFSAVGYRLVIDEKCTRVENWYIDYRTKSRKHSEPPRKQTGLDFMWKLSNNELNLASPNNLTLTDPQNDKEVKKKRKLSALKLT